MIDILKKSLFVISVLHINYLFPLITYCVGGCVRACVRMRIYVVYCSFH